MKRKVIFLLLMISVILMGIAYSQPSDDRAERSLQELRRLRKLIKKPAPYKLSSTAGIFIGYDNNVYLAPTRKDDMYEEFLYSLDFVKPFGDGFGFEFDYDLNYVNYNEATDATNMLNHLRLELNKRFADWKIGAGYDLGFLYYFKDDDDNFLFHRGFIYVQKQVLDTIHVIGFEGGIKDYTDQNALGDTIFSRQDKERSDERMAVYYAIAFKITPKLFTKFKTKFSINDSNARYVDYYDYKSYQHSLSFKYKLLEDLDLSSTFSYRRKLYDSRTVTLRDYRQKDNLYTATVGLDYKIDSRNTISLSYAYRQNESNDGLEEYTESVINCGWLYSF